MSDAETLRRIALRVRLAERELDHAVTAARAAGVSWQRIGDAVGTSRQAAHQRWHKVEQTQTGRALRMVG